MGGASNVAFKRDPNINRDFNKDFKRDFNINYTSGTRAQAHTNLTLEICFVFFLLCSNHIMKAHGAVYIG